jgi:hypothetical protein
MNIDIIIDFVLIADFRLILTVHPHFQRFFPSLFHYNRFLSMFTLEDWIPVQFVLPIFWEKLGSLRIWKWESLTFVEKKHWNRSLSYDYKSQLCRIDLLTILHWAQLWHVKYIYFLWFICRLYMEYLCWK